MSSLPLALDDLLRHDGGMPLPAPLRSDMERLFNADFGGVQSVAPLLAGLFLVAGLAGLSLPGLSSFVSEFLVLLGTFTRYKVAAVFATVNIILAAVYILWMYQRTMNGPVREQVKGFSLYALKAVMSGRGDSIIDLALSNLSR